MGSAAELSRPDRRNPLALGVVAWVILCVASILISWVFLSMHDNALLAAFPDSSYHSCGTCAFNHMIGRFFAFGIHVLLPWGLALAALVRDSWAFKLTIFVLAIPVTLMFASRTAWLLDNMPAYPQTAELIPLEIVRVIITAAAIALFAVLLLLQLRRKARDRTQRI